jgi:putative endonuclease
MFNILKRTSFNYKLGRRGEELAAEYLKRKSFSLVTANFTTPVGRNRRGALVAAEIDLIAYDGPILCFIEIKTRTSAHFAPESAVNLRKQRQITRAAKAYRKIFHLSNSPFRFDVVSVILNEEQNHLKIELFRNFWTENRFRKSVWINE